VRCIINSEFQLIQGCTDYAACNYLTNAESDDGSCLYFEANCDDGYNATYNDVINNDCTCSGTLNGNIGAQVLPGNATCAMQSISVTGCGGQTSLAYDGRTYELVEISGQCWFADNLATDQYRNGDLIPTVLEYATWQNITSGAYAIYNNNPVNDATYGKLYNWYTIVDSRGVCPAGWHVPTDCEWMYLEGSLGMSVQVQQQAVLLRGSNEGGALKSISTWNYPNEGASNSIGFTALAGGELGFDAVFHSLGNSGLWWSSSEYDTNNAWFRQLYHNNSHFDRGANKKIYGKSIRCIKD
jgi:hypothetical protein